MTYAWIPKKSRNTSEQPACHDLLIVLRYAMKSRVIYLYWLSRRNSIYLFIAIFILCYSCSPSKYGHALNFQNLYVEMGSKENEGGWGPGLALGSQLALHNNCQTTSGCLVGFQT